MQGKWSPCEKKKFVWFWESEKIMIADKGKKREWGKKFELSRYLLEVVPVSDSHL